MAFSCVLIFNSWIAQWQLFEKKNTVTQLQKISIFGSYKHLRQFLKISLKKYLLYSSVFAIFTEAFFFHFIIDWKLLYLIIFVNYVLLFKIKKITINKYFALLLLGLFCHGILANIIIGIPPNYLIAQLLGILVIGNYYYNLILLYIYIVNLLVLFFY